LIGEYWLRPLSEAILYEGLGVPVTIVRDDHVGLPSARRPVGIALGCEFDVVPRLLLKVGKEVIVEATLLRCHD
jgi:hypothetical protein